MKITLRRNLAMRGGPQNAEVHMRLVFADITDKIWITAVKSQPAGNSMFPNQETIEVDYELQDSAKPGDNIDQIIRNAVALREDLTLLSLEAPLAVLKMSGITNRPPP